MFNSTILHTSVGISRKVNIEEIIVFFSLVLMSSISSDIQNLQQYPAAHITDTYIAIGKQYASKKRQTRMIRIIY